MTDQIEQDVLQIIAEILELDPSKLQSENLLEQIINIDSIALLEIVVSLERRFGIEINQPELKDIKHLHQLVDIIRQKISQLET